MIQKRLIFLLILISFKISIADDCTSRYEQSKKTSCQAIRDTSSGLYCDFIDNECKNWYRECEDYTATSDFDDAICTKITPSNSVKKCYVDSSTSTKQCKAKNKDCSELSENNCLLLDLSSENKRCVFRDGKCEEHSDSCTGLDSSKCEKNIPSQYSKKCYLDGSTCKETDRKCLDFIDYKDIYHSYFSCNSLTSSSTSKTCTTDNNTCKELYKSCSVITTKNDCENKELISNSPGYKCVWDTSCQLKQKLCSEYKTGEGSSLCSSYTTENPSYKKCAYEFSNGVDKCKEVYKTCDSYNKVITDKDKRKDEDCEAIELSGSDKCILDSDTKECKQVKKECKDYDSELACYWVYLDDESKKCIFLKGKCEEEYKNCQTFKYDSSLSSDDNKRICESITPIGDYKDSNYYYGTNRYKCVYSDSEHTCTQKEIKKCEDYEGYSPSFCSSMPSEDSNNLKCILKDDKCITQYKYCSSYDIVVTDKSKRKKDECESIDSGYEYQKCHFDEEYKVCNTETLPCSSYKGNSSSMCQQFEAKDDFACYLENGQCIERKKYDYQYCYEYHGEDKSICESIQPRNYFSSSYNFSKKCVYNTTDKECQGKDKTCSDARNALECQQITPSNTNKKCIYKDDSCVEQYKTCELYATSGETIVQSTCESIIDDNNKKCVYSTNTCKSETKKCSDFNLELLKSSCYYLNPTDDTKKCTYSSNACTTTDKKTCLELFGSKDATKEICEAASTTSDKRSCALISLGSGCDEVNKQSNTNSYGGKGMQLSKIIFALVCLLL